MQEGIVLFEKRLDPGYGVVRLILYPEGLSLWAGGEMRWPNQKGDGLPHPIAVSTYNQFTTEGFC